MVSSCSIPLRRLLPEPHIELLPASKEAIPRPPCLFYLYKKLPYDVLTDFAPVSLVASSPSVLLVNPALPVHSVKELVGLAKSKPGVLNYAAAGAGTNPHIAGELFNKLGGVEMTVIQYRGGGPAVTAVLGGEVGLMFSNVSESSSFIKAGKLRALAVTGSRRSKVFPDLPTVAEAGIKGYEFSTWHGLLAPKGTPKEIVRKINEKLVEAIQSPEIAQRCGQSITRNWPVCISICCRLPNVKKPSVRVLWFVSTDHFFLVLTMPRGFSSLLPR